MGTFHSAPPSTAFRSTWTGWGSLVNVAVNLDGSRCFISKTQLPWCVWWAGRGGWGRGGGEKREQPSRGALPQQALRE